MLRKLLSTFFCVLMILSFNLNQSQAQINGELGIRGGISWPDLYDPESYADFTYNTGYAAGIYYSTQIANTSILFQPELLYIQKGFKADISIYNNNYRLEYLELPLLARYNFKTTSQFVPFIYAGPYVGLNISAETNAQYIADAANFIPNSILDEEVKPLEFGVVAGAGLGIGRFDLGLRYEAGLTEVFKNYKGKNHILSIFTGVGF